jgi:hypothetical protein
VSAGFILGVLGYPIIQTHFLVCQEFAGILQDYLRYLVRCGCLGSLPELCANIVILHALSLLVCFDNGLVIPVRGG